MSIIRSIVFGLIVVGSFTLSWSLASAIADSYLSTVGPRANCEYGFAVEGPLNTDNDIFDEIAFLSIERGMVYVHVSEAFAVWSKLGPLWSDVDVADLAVGDFNGDGYSDVAVSNPLYDTAGCTDVGMIEIYYGGGQGLGSGGSTVLVPGSSNPVPVPNAQNGLYFGWSIDAVDEGSYDYLLVGAPGLNIDQDNSGYAVLYDLKNGQKLWDTGIGQASYPGHNTGVCVRDLKGLYGDNVVCFGVSNYYYAAPLWNDPNIAGYFSIVWIIHEQGNQWITTSVTGTMKESSWNLISPTQFGSSFSAGDFNGDGYVDLVVGEPRTNSATSTVYIYAGTSDGLVTGTPIVSIQQQGGTDFGIEVSTIGDVNNDGMDDFLVGAPLYDYNGVMDNGRVYLYVGGPFSQIPNNNMWNLYGGNPTGNPQYLGGSREICYGPGGVVGGGKTLWGLRYNYGGDSDEDFLIGSPYYYDVASLNSKAGYFRLYYG